MPTTRESSGHLAYLPLLIANVVLSVGVPPLLVHFLHLDVFEQIPLEVLLGLVVFIAVSMIEVLFYSKSLFELKSQSQKLEIIENRVDSALHNIKVAIRSLGVVDGKPDVIFSYFYKKLEGLEHELAAVAGAKELRVDAEHLYLTDIVLGVFKGDVKDAISAVHRLKYNAQLLDAHELQWLRKVNACVKADQVKRIARLMLYSSPADLESEATIRIVSAHNNSRGYDYRVLDEKIFERLLIEYGVDKNTVDFALYANKILFKVTLYGPQSVAAGVYTKDEDQIKQYADVYKMCWEQGKKLDGSKIRKGITMETLLA